MISDCALCNELKKMSHIAYLGNHAFVLVNLRLLRPGHVLVLPREHRENFDEMTAAESKEMFEIIEKCSRALKKVYGYFPIVVINPLPKRSERHIHIHLVPSDRGARDYIALVDKLPYNVESPSEIREVVREEIAKAMEGA